MNDGSPPPARRVGWRGLLRIVSVVAAVSVLALTLTGLLIPPDPFWEGRASGIYWLENPPSGVATGFMMASIAALLWLGFALTGWIVRNRKSQFLTRVLGAIGAVLVVLVVLTLAGPGEIGVSRKHMDSLRTGGRVYLLADRQTQVSWRHVLCDPRPPVDPYFCTEPIYEHQGLLFECGPLGLICRRVYATEPSRDRYALALGQDADTGEVLLLDGVGGVVDRYAP